MSSASAVLNTCIKTLIDMCIWYLFEPIHNRRGTTKYTRENSKLKCLLICLHYFS